jgi:N-acetylglucosamine-6-phosphate deacetylase
VRLGVEAAVVDGELIGGDVEIIDDRVAAVGLAGSGRGIAIPGLVDLQVNGFAGVDLAAADEDAYREISRALAASGTTSFQPTFVTASEEALTRALRRVPVDLVDRRVLGVHLEGPFLSAARLGAHAPSARRDPDASLLERLLDAGPVSHVTLAPELAGALELIDLLHVRGVVVSLGHSDATAVQADAAFTRGVRTVTHLFNAMRPFVPRDPGIAGAALARDDVIVQLIVDGHHLAPETVRVVWRAAPGRVALVSDSIAAAGAGDGQFRLGPLDVAVTDGVARRADGVLAGSTLTLLAAVRNLHALGAPLAQAVSAASELPARVAGRPDLGVLRPGAIADLVVLDDQLAIASVMLAGRPVPHAT